MQRLISKAFLYAVNLLAFRDYTEREICEKLIKKGYDESIVKQVVKDLIQKGYIDDNRYAEQWVKNKAKSKGIGAAKIKYELSRKGIPYDLIEEKLEESKDFDELEIAMGVAYKKIKSYKNMEKDRIKAKLGRFLERKGFSYNVINKVIDNLFQ
ncbi:MAG: regulatory protein [Thermosediminibacterales bacterium]|jgi:regulatory protein|nr:regulatory protein [Thermosediminibacterales bacterium]MDK2901495.1 regulatory protein [Thermosediminibacterales bacterium]